jgi:hypothetical protein
MNLVFLHGRPATGKLTIARKLVTLTNYQLYHNHVAVDEALQLHAFGTPGFIQRREQLWREFFIRAARQLPPGVIFTFSAENTVPQSFIDWMFGEWSAIGIRLLSIELVASETTIESRLVANQRKHFKKITELPLYRELKSRNAFNSPIIPRSDFRINTEKSSSDEAAREIITHFKLNEPTG